MLAELLDDGGVVEKQVFASDGEAYDLTIELDSNENPFYAWDMF